MTKFIIPILFLLASGALFWGFVDPEYAKVKELRSKEQLYSDALNNSEKLQEIRDELLNEYNSFSTVDLSRMEKFLPNHVDNVRLIRDIDGIAAKYGMVLSGVRVDVSSNPDEINVSSEGYGNITLDFSVTGSYKVFLSFLKDLERSLRIVDVTSISFSSSEKDLYEYDMSIRTYWLK